MPDTTDDVRAAIEAASSGEQPGTPPAAPVENDFAPQRSEVLPPVQPDENKGGDKPAPKDATGRERGADGRFVPDQPHPVQPAAPETPPAPSTPPTDEGSVRFDPAKPPSGWTQAGKDKWNSIPQDIREEITRREQATAYGVQKLMQQYEPMEDIYGAVAQHAEYFNRIQENPVQYLNSMMTVEQTLRMGNPAQKMEMMIALGETYGVPLRKALDEATGGRLNEILQRSHEYHKTPPVVPAHIQQELREQRAWREQVEDAAANDELASFAAAPGHELLQYAREDMANLIEAGVVESYQDAYDLAVWRNPQLRAIAAARQAGQAMQTGVAERQRAAAAVVAPSSAPLATGAEGNKDGDVYDDVRAAWNSSVRGGGV